MVTQMLATLTASFHLIFCPNMADLEEVAKCMVDQGHTGYELIGYTHDLLRDEQVYIAFKPDNSWLNIRPVYQESRYGHGDE